MFISNGLPRILFYNIYLKNHIALLLSSNKQYVTINRVNILDKTILDKTILDKTILDKTILDKNNDKQNDILNINKWQDIASMEKIKRQKYVEKNVKYYNTHKMTSYICKNT
jgi:CRISPR/Cas system CSM-associated protein Csm5 (group 7 of RAMP superfamily)